MEKTTIKNQFPLEFYRPELQIFTVMHVVRNKKTNHDDKYPLNASTGKIMKWKKDPNFLDLDTAERYLTQLRSKTPNEHFEIGMLVQSPYVLLDLDGIDKEVEDLKNGVASQRIKDLIKLTKNCYIEVSQSGKGLHFIFEGKKTTTISHTTNYELYDNNRWLALTGNYLHMPSQLPQLDENDMKQLEQYLFKDELKKKAKMSQNTDKSAMKGNNLELDQIIDKIKKSKQADNFNALWQNTDGSNPSSGDQQLANILIWWVNHDVTKADQLFRQSARMRPKWDEVHSSDGRTYGQLTLENADATVDGGYIPKRQLNENPDDIDVKSMDDLIKKLQAQRMAWDLQHTDDKGNVAQIHDTDIIDIIEDTVPLTILYSKESEIPDSPLYYYNYDTGVYCDDKPTLEKFILSVAPEKTSINVRKNILDTLRKKPSNKIETHQLTTMSDPFHRYIAVGNGVFDTETKELLPYSPSWYFVTKTATNYNQNATTEPEYNGWSMSKNIKAIAGGQKDKEKLLWEVCKAAVTGDWWSRKAVLLVDKGQGQTGKSTFEEALIGIVGEENTTQLRLADMQDETKLIDGVNKTLIVGDDNDVNEKISLYSYLNPIISGEPIRVRNYYEKSRLAQFHSFIIQSANGLPPFVNATEAFFKRLIVIMFDTQHNAKDKSDFAVKHDYIHRKEWQEWFLWYLLNKVDLGITLTDTKESQQLLGQSQLENDTIGNFVDNWLPTLSSTKIPSAWLYALYSSACTIDSLNPLSKRVFTRKLCDNPKFAKDWEKVNNTRIVPEKDFFYDDACQLLRLSSSIKWGHHVQSFFPITRKTISDGDNNHRESASFDVITEDDFVKTLKAFHATTFVKKGNQVNLTFEVIQKNDLFFCVSNDNRLLIITNH